MIILEKNPPSIKRLALGMLPYILSKALDQVRQRSIKSQHQEFYRFHRSLHLPLLNCLRLKTVPFLPYRGSTALVHEAWLRLNQSDRQEWHGREHFFRAAAEAMRRILVENARRKLRLRHGGPCERVDYEVIDLPIAADDEKCLRSMKPWTGWRRSIPGRRTW